MKLPYRGLLCLLAMVTCTAWCAGTIAAEPAREFLAGLRERGLHDVALEYLEMMSASDLAPADFSEVLLYEKGLTLVDGAARQRDLSLREQQLDEAQVSLQQFISEHAEHVLVTAARSQLGNLLVERGHMKLEASKKGNRDELVEQAKDLYVKAYDVFTAVKQDLYQILADRPKVYGPKEQAEKAITEQYRNEYLQAQLLAAAVLEENADTFPPKSEHCNELLEKAAEEYKAIYEKYRTRLAGILARMCQGRCLQKLGKFDNALSFYTADILSQPDADEFRPLKTKTLLLALECWLDPSQKKYAEAVSRGSQWVDGARPNEAEDPDWLALRVALARAHLAYADDLALTKPKDKQIRSSQEDARKLLRFVVRYPSEHQDEARRMLAAVPGANQVEQDRPKPTTFDEAKTAGREALDQMQTASLQQSALPDRIAQETDEQIKADLQSSLAEANETFPAARDQAIDYFQQALGWADAETPREDVNVVKYFLSYLYYVRGDYFEAALLGEDLAKRNPDAAGAAQSAKIAMASYLKLYAENATADRKFETDRVVSIAEYIVNTWEGQTEATEALNTLIPFMIKQGELEKAQEYLRGIPADSPHRGEAELKTGQAMWSAYLAGIGELREWESSGSPPAGVELEARKAELEELKNGAMTTLADGISRMKESGEVDTIIAIALLSLAQIYVDTNQPEKAMLILEAQNIGLLALVKGNHPAAAGEGFAAETYKTGLRAYIAALPSAGNQSKALIEKAKQAMEDLEQAVVVTPADQEKLVTIYIGLARDLGQQLELLTSPEQKQALAVGYESFLTEVGKGSSEFNIVNWVAETFDRLGEQFAKDKKLAAESKRYYGKAIETYQQQILGRAEELGLSADIQRRVQMKMALTLREMGDYQKSLEVFTDLLLANEMLLNVQVEAARTLQQWGASGNSSYFDKAIKGDKLNKKTNSNTIWGWIRLANRTGRYKKFHSTFHEARYNLAQCHYQYALRKKSADDKKQYLQYAENDIITTQQLYPDMGEQWGWKAKYDELLRKIQTAQNKQPTGLPEFRPPAPRSQNRSASRS